MGNPKAVVKAVEKEEVTDTTLAIKRLTATKVNELTVNFKNAVDTANTAVTVTKGSDTVATASTTWAADGKSLVIKTSANMVKGTYKVTVKNDTEEVSATTDVTSQKVTEIKILNTVALTGSVTSGSATTDSMKAYVYYDVLDQYGESMKNSTTIDWSTSCGKPEKNNKTRGVLTVQRSDDKAFTYGESIYVTGVHAKTGVSVTATLTVGQAQALNSIEVKGFVKKGTSEILTTLPAGFKSKAYYLIYSATDQNGNEMEAATYLTKSEVTFISDSILVIKDITKDDETTLTIDGVEYCAAFLAPGDDVNKGGEVNITAIANKTGNKSVVNVVVGDSQILKSFTIGEPSSVVADGESVEIPFTALDQNGNEVKNFVALASQSDFNKLQLNASVGTLSLVEKNDGTAALVWTDEKMGWSSDSEDGIDRPVSLTAVVIGGETSNEMLYVSDKAMPVAIASVDMNSVYVQKGEEELTLSSFTFIDQYGRNMKDLYKNSPYSADRDANTENENKGYIYDNGFFTYVNTSGLDGLDFDGYKFGVKVEFKGNGDNLLNYTSTNGYDVITSSAIEKNVKHVSVVSAGGVFASGAAFQITSSSSLTASADQTLKFSIEKYETANRVYNDVSPIVNKSFKGVSIDRISGFEIKDLNTFYVQTDLSKQINGAIGGLTKENIASTGGITKLGTVTIPKAYQKEVKVTGKFNGATVDIPKMYYNVAGEKLGAVVDNYVVSKGAVNQNTVSAAAVTLGALQASDLYDANSAQFTRKLASDTLKVTVYKASNGAVEVTDSAIVNTATKQIAISDAAPYAAEICAEDAYTATPNKTKFDSLVSPGAILSAKDVSAYKAAYRTDGTKWVVKDQYGVVVSDSSLKYSYKITQVVENADRYAENNFTVNKNDTADASIKGAELGDTFILTITASYNGGTASKDIKITVGADSKAHITNGQNVYSDSLVYDKLSTGAANPSADGLEAQRQAALGKN